MIITLVSTESECSNIANILLNERLAACVNVIPKIKSYYWWNDKIQEDNEYLMLIKSSKHLEPNIINRISELHSYDVPAIYSIDSTKLIYEPYLKWINKETNQE